MRMNLRTKSALFPQDRNSDDAPAKWIQGVAGTRVHDNNIAHTRRCLHVSLTRAEFPKLEEILRVRHKNLIFRREKKKFPKKSTRN